MKRSMISTLASLLVFAGGPGCMPTDNVVGGKPLSAAGTAGGGDLAQAGGTAQGGRTGDPAINRGGSAGIPTIEAGGTGGTVTIATGGTTGYPTGCEDYLDTTTGHAIEMVIKNDRSTPVYVGNRLSGCSNDESFRIYDSTGTEVAVDDDPIASCTCQDFMTHGSKGCMIRSCLRSPMHRIDPGASLTLNWDGLYLAQRTFRAACGIPGETAEYCNQAVAAASGRYKVVITGSSSYECPFGTSNAECSCAETNSCAYVPVQGAGDLFEPSTEFDLMSTTSVTVRFTNSMGGSGGATTTIGGNGGTAGSNDSGTNGGAPPAAGGGGNGGTGTGGAPSVNIHNCVSPAQYPCYQCDPLPAASTEGCPPAKDCSVSDATSTVRYPLGCAVVFSYKNRYYPEYNQTAMCAGTTPFWACQL